MPTPKSTKKNWWGLKETPNPDGKLECAWCGKKPKVLGKWERMGFYFCGKRHAQEFIEANS